MERLIPVRWTRRLLALALAMAGAGRAATAATAYYVRFRISNDTMAYAQIQGNSMRMASSTEGLQTAKASKAYRASSGVTQFRNASLPVDASKLAPSCQSISAQLSLYGRFGRHIVYGSATVTMQDQSKARWSYLARIQVKPGTKAEAAPVIDLTGFKKLTIAFATRKQRSRQMGIGLYLRAGSLTLQDVRKNGRPVLMSVTVSDSNGRRAASKKGRLSDFGFG